MAAARRAGTALATDATPTSVARTAAIVKGSVGLTSNSWLDNTRLRSDTGFEPQYDTATAAADYIAWLRMGNKR